MTAKEIIHAAEDVPALLKCAAEMGLIIQHDAPSALPEAQIISGDQLNTYERGVFLLYRPEWVLGELQFERISAGHNRGKYFQKPRVNLHRSS